MLRRLAPALSWALLVWAFALVLYFQHKEGLFELTKAPLETAGTSAGPVQITDAGEEIAAPPATAPGGFLAPSERPGAFRTILRSTALPWRVWTSHIPWFPMAIAAGMIVWWTTLGALLLRALPAYMPRHAFWPLAFALGTGLAAWLFQAVTLAGVLNQATALGVMIGATLALCILNFATGRPDPHDVFDREAPSLIPAVRARQWFRDSVPPPAEFFERTFWGAGVVIAGLITLLVFLHAVAFPETYWDSLILYLGHARAIFTEGAFPNKVVAQVGIGLGANYPHLFSLLTAGTAAAAGTWHEQFGQWIAPASSLGATVLVYAILRELTRDRVAAMAGALLFRLMPYGIAYGQFASPYAVALLYTAGFLYCALMFLSYRLPVYFALCALLAAWSVHLNYLMALLWLLLPVLWLLSRGGQVAPPPRPHDPFDLEPPSPVEALRPPDFMTPGKAPRFLQPAVLLPLLGALILAAPWYVRNLIVTGNPVYAFFNSLFWGRHVNPEVLDSAAIEWLLNGDGIGRAGRTLPEKIANSWMFFVTGAQHWKLSPVIGGYTLPGLLVFLGAAMAHIRRRPAAPDRSGHSALPYAADLRFGWLAFLLLAALFAYEYLLADYYLYHILIVLPLLALFGALTISACTSPIPRKLLLIVTLFAAFSPGIVMGLLGFKLKQSGRSAGVVYAPLELSALRNLFIDPTLFRRMEYGGDMDMFFHLNSLPLGTRILTHENRHLLHRPQLEIVHLDDWEVQAAYDRPAAERLAILEELGVTHYLYVPNEDKHRINARLGMDELIGLGHFAEEAQFPSPGRSTRDGLDYEHIPPDRNILYRRAAGAESD